jgi:single-stranded-DNA-specific exonuclease
MKINRLFPNTTDIENIEVVDYLKALGVENPIEFLRFDTFPKPLNYDKMNKAIELYRKHCTEVNRPIYWLVDCDVDGLMSSGIGMNITHRVYPNKEQRYLLHDKNPKAHGLADKQIMEQLKTLEPSLLMIPDAGSSDEEQLKELIDLGWCVIVLDHHLPEKVKPYLNDNSCGYIINSMIDDAIPNKNASGALVTFYFFISMEETIEVACDYVSMVATSIISDSMSMLNNENATIVWNWLSEIDKSGNFGTLMKMILKDKPLIPVNLSFGGIIPKMNATVRVGTLEEKTAVFNSLIGTYNNLDDVLKILNRCVSRQKHEAERIINDGLIKTVYDNKCLLAKVDEDTPLTGFIANKLMSKYNKPILLLHDNNDEVLGSVRSPVDFNSVLSQCKYFNWNRGHEGAFGTCYNKSEENNVINYLDGLTIGEPQITVVADLNTNFFNTKVIDTFKELDKIWANNLPKPKFCLNNIRIKKEDIYEVGNGTTVKFYLGGICFIKFFCSKDWKKEHIKDDMFLTVVGSLDWNEYNGNKTPQLIIDKWLMNEVKKVTFEDLFGSDDTEDDSLENFMKLFE